jgi:hypothetical protein
VVHELARVQQRRHGSSATHERQRAVVVAATPAEPGPGAIDGESRHEHRVGGGDRVRAEPPPERLAGAERPRDQPGPALIDDPVQTLGPDHRKEDLGAGVPHRVQQIQRSRLAPHGDVRGDPTGAGEPGQQVSQQRVRRGSPVRRTERAPGGVQTRPPSRLAAFTGHAD